jgi:IS5 family transposase
MGLDLPVPDHTTLSRRARTWKPSARSNDRQHVADGPIHVLVDSTGLKIYGAGQWLEEKHGAKSRRGWRKLHLAVDADSGEIIAHSLTDQETGDASQLEPLLDQIDDEIGQFTADGAYDGAPPMTLCCVTAQAQGSSFHRARTRLNGPTPKHPARETIT